MLKWRRENRRERGKVSYKLTARFKTRIKKFYEIEDHVLIVES